MSDNDGSQVSCGQFGCDPLCTYASLPGEVCVDRRRAATSTCGNVGVSQATSQCLLDPTQPGCRPLDRAGSTGYATCNDGSAFPVMDLGSRSFSQLSGPETKEGTEQSRINQLMNNAAAAVGCVHDVDANPILESGETGDQGKDDDEDDHHHRPRRHRSGEDAHLRMTAEAEADHGHQRGHRHDNGGKRHPKSVVAGWKKWFGSRSDPARGCGVVYFHRALGCAFPMANASSSVPDAALATEPHLLRRYLAEGAEAGALGLPTSFPTAAGSGVSWQRFSWGYLTHRSPDARAYLIGGKGNGALALAYSPAVLYGREFDTAGSEPNHLPLASDPVCLGPSARGGCGAGMRGQRSTTYPYLGSTNHYVWEAGSSLAFRVRGQIAEKWFQESTTPELGCAGFPTGPEVCGDPGCTFSTQEFARAALYLVPEGRREPVTRLDSDALAAYRATGGPQGPLGLPARDAPSCGSRGPRTIEFEHGRLELTGNLAPLAGATLFAPEPARDLQIGAYQKGDVLHLVASGVEKGSTGPHRVRFNIPFVIFGFRPGTQLETSLCPHKENRVRQPILASGAGWVEVSDDEGYLPATNETCRVSIWYPVFSTTRPDSRGSANWAPGLLLRFSPPSASATIRVWRQVIDPSGQAGPWVDITNTIGSSRILPAGTFLTQNQTSLAAIAEVFDPLPTDLSSDPVNRENCYRIETVGAGDTNVACAFVSNVVHPISRAELTLTTFGQVNTEGPIPVRVRLQDGAGGATPTGNISWLDTPDVNWGTNASGAAGVPAGLVTQTFDLATSNVSNLEDITQISVELVDPTPYASLCIQGMTLVIDNDGSAHDRVAYEMPAAKGKCIDGATGPLTISFADLRSAGAWQSQLQSYGQITPHFFQFPGGFDFRSLLESAVASSLGPRGSHFVHTSPFAVVKGTNDQRAGVSMSIADAIDLNVGFEMALVTTFGCVWDDTVAPPGSYDEVLDVGLLVDTGTVFAEPSNPGISLGLEYLLKIVSFFTYDLNDDINERIRSSFGGGGTDLGSGGAGTSLKFYWTFTPRRVGSVTDVGLSPVLSSVPPFAPTDGSCPTPP